MDEGEEMDSQLEMFCYAHGELAKGKVVKDIVPEAVPIVAALLTLATAVAMASFRVSGEIREKT